MLGVMATNKLIGNDHMKAININDFLVIIEEMMNVPMPDLKARIKIMENKWRKGNDA
jgi:hypothetical protein